MLDDEILEEINAALEKMDELSTRLLNSMIYFTNLRNQVISAAHKKKTVGVI